MSGTAWNVNPESVTAIATVVLAILTATLLSRAFSELTESFWDFHGIEFLIQGVGW
jgi:hypothetical protein